MIHAVDPAQQALLAHAIAAQLSDDDSDRGQRATLSRREFLRSSSAAGLVLGFACLPACGALATSPVDRPGPPVHAPFTPNAFVRVAPDNIVTIVCKHLEMGQGNTTGLATLVVDELDADWSLARTGCAVLSTGDAAKARRAGKQANPSTSPAALLLRRKSRRENIARRLRSLSSLERCAAIAWASSACWVGSREWIMHSPWTPTVPMRGGSPLECAGKWHIDKCCPPAHGRCPHRSP